jgi:hypothetical protein
LIVNVLCHRCCLHLSRNNVFQFPEIVYLPSIRKLIRDGQLESQLEGLCGQLESQLEGLCGQLESQLEGLYGQLESQLESQLEGLCGQLES